MTRETKLDMKAERDRTKSAQRTRQRTASVKRPHRPVSKFVDNPGPGETVVRGITAADGEDELLYSAAHLEAYGTRSMPFLNVTTDNWLRVLSPSRNASEERFNAAVAIMAATEPQNELEATLASQMVAANECAFQCMRRFSGAEWADHAKLYGDMANKFMRTFTAQVEALANLRRGGEQIVKHVYVQQGGQAVIAGTVNTGVGVNAESAEQAHGADTVAAGTAMLSQDPSWNGVPVPGDAQWAMQNPRGQVAGTAAGQPERLQTRAAVSRGDQVA